MNVCFLLQDIGAVYGAERATLDLARGLRGAGVEVSFLLIKETRLGPVGSGLESAILKDAHAVHSVTTAKRFSLRLVREIRGALREMNADGLHCVGPKATLHGGLATRWGREVPVVSTVHGWLFRSEWKERFYTWLEQRALTRCSAVVVLSTFYRDLLEGMGVSRVRHIPSGLDADGLGIGESPSGFTVGMMARFSEEKNHGLLLEALAGRVAMKALFAGEGPLRTAVEERAESLGVADRVRFEGYLDRDAFLSQINVLVLCSRIENLPYSVLEAMAWRIPVVVTRVGGLPDLVEDGVTGFLVEPGDVEGMEQALTRLAEDPDLCLRMGKAGRAKVEREFGVEQMVEAHLSMYRSLAE